MTAAFRATAPGFAAPAGATDCHIHIIGQADDYPFASRRSYATLPATADDYRAVMAATGLHRAVVVQPSFYGTDNRCTLDAVEALGIGARGVAVIDPSLGDDPLKAMDTAGIRGVRVNLASIEAGEPIERMVRQLDDRVAALGWHIQVFTPPEHLPSLAALNLVLESQLVIDHFGMVRPDMTAVEPMRTYLSALLVIAEGGGWVKLSGLYRVADDPLAPSLAALARRLVSIAPDRVIWGSDWPHTPPHGRMASLAGTLLPFRDIDTGALLAPLASWFPDEAVRRRVLVDNPAALYGF